MKDDTEYKVCYVNEETGEQVEFKHCIPVRFNREEAERFVKNMHFDRWYAGAKSYPKDWTMQAIKVEFGATSCWNMFGGKK